MQPKNWLGQTSSRPLTCAADTRSVPLLAAHQCRVLPGKSVLTYEAVNFGLPVLIGENAMKTDQRHSKSIETSIAEPDARSLSESSVLELDTGALAYVGGGILSYSFGASNP